MASLITPQFERYVAEQIVARGTVQFDEFIFANIPGLNENNLAQYLTMPTSAQIVHRQVVSQSGVINENAVVYSVTIGTEVGDFDFNFIGLINRSKNLLAVAVQTDTVKKIRNKNAVQGNSITRNILLEFSGAKALTGINVNANTWQIDFTVRLHGLDEKIRLTNRDLYGRAVFFDDSFLVKRKTGNQFTIQPGNAYVEGVRMDLGAEHHLTANSLPCSIYADVVHHCTVTGEYQTEIKYLTQSKADYVDTANRQHYVQILADIDSKGNVTDRRLLSPFLGMNPLTLDDTTENTKDKLGHTHKLPIASLVKKGIVKLFSGYDSDAEDMAATPKAIKGLKALIDAITRNLGNYIPNSKKSSRVDSNSAETVATSAAVKTANDNANGRVSKSGDTMTGNLTVPNIIVNDPTNNNNSVQIGDDTKLIDVDMGHTVGLQATDNANDAYIAYGATKKRFGFDGVNFTAESGLGAQWFGSQKRGEGAYVNQWRTEAPYHVQAGNANGSNTYFPYLKGKVTNGDGWGSAFSFGYTTPGARNQFGTGIIHLIEDNGSEKTWRFEHNGNFNSSADVVTGSGKSLNNTHQQSYDYVQVTSSTSYGGLSILKPDGKSMRFERQGNAFKFWCQDMYSILMPERGGTVLLDTDFFYQKIGNFEVRKYPDGTMIQTYAVNVGEHQLTTGKLKTFNWAVAFASTPMIWVTANATDNRNGAQVDLGALVGIVLSDCTQATCAYRTGEIWQDRNHNPTMQFLAIGRWK
ncbi:phage tail protein [uncultured Haemophilus sp.]|uniref:phage tail-collar fiber domain-containing protein n=1 Tax=uncultured Haemophilus sp. TaxID=237779 RepID=UPI0025850936|nr:phage tail protein [uncultured Haemophilus sp.]